MSSAQPHPSKPWRFFVVAALLILLAYPVSLGPACWLISRRRWEIRDPDYAYAISRFYCPLAPVVLRGPLPIQKAMKWWIGIGLARDSTLWKDYPDAIIWSHPGWTYTFWHLR